MSSKKRLSELTKGIIRENPVIGMMLGLCSVLAISNEVRNAIGMGIAMTFVLLGSNISVSLLRRSIPKRVRIPVFLVIIGSLTTIVDLVMAAYAPAIHRNLGIFIPLIVVNCIIIARAEAFASKNALLSAVIDALGMGIGYTMVLFVIATIREVSGNSSFLGIRLFNFEPVLIMVLPPGAFITIGLLMAVVRGIKK